MYVEKINNEKLRKKAEQILQKQVNPTFNQYLNDDYLYDFRLSLIELEIMNNELKDNKIKFKESRDKYIDRYKLAPVAYFILNEKGFILDYNYEGAKLLGSEKHEFHKKAFIEYVYHDHRKNFHQYYIRTLKVRNKQSIDLKLRKIEDYFYAHLESISIRDRKGNFQELVITVTDIDNLMKSEKSHIDEHKKDKINWRNLSKN